MRVLETDNWSLLLPPEWQAEQDDDGVFISDRDGVGCLEISVLVSEAGVASLEDLRSLSGAPDALESVRLADRQAWTARYEEEGVALREWWLLSDDAMLLITYSCELENAGMDDAIVDDILSTLRLAVED